MAEAIISRLIASGTSLPSHVSVREISPERSQYLRSEYNVTICESYEQLVETVDVLVVAIKPQIFTKNRQSFALSNSSTVACVLSIMAGTSIAALEATFTGPVVRIMPNTPATVGFGMSAVSLGTDAGEADQAIAQTIFTAVGEVVFVPESAMDAVTALSGSGPAYVAIAIEALSDAGVAVGLSRQIALQLALQTVRGSAELLHLSQLHPAAMKDKVASPGGTTIAGIAALEKAGVRNAYIEAVRAAYDRSRELAQLSEG